MKKFDFKEVIERIKEVCLNPPEALPYKTRFSEYNDHDHYDCYYENEDRAAIFLTIEEYGDGYIYYHKFFDGGLYQFFTGEHDNLEDQCMFILMLADDFPEILKDFSLLLPKEESTKAMNYLKREFQDYYDRD